MGQTGSNMMKKYVTPLWKSTAQDVDENTQKALARFGGSPYVLTRRSSMYFDEDGDLAHEFYEQKVVRKRRGRRKVIMCKRNENLTPQGEVELNHPRLHTDFPVILCEAPTS